MEAKQILEQAINGVLQEKALSKEAIDAVQVILTENETLKKTDENRRAELVTARETINKQDGQLNTQETRLLLIDDREQKVTAREKTADLLDLKVQYEQTRVNDHKTIFETIFKNTIVRKSVNGYVGNPNSDQNKYNGSLSENSTEEIREE